MSGAQNAKHQRPECRSIGSKVIAVKKSPSCLVEVSKMSARHGVEQAFMPAVKGSKYLGFSR